MEERQKKVFAGPRIRRLRRELGLSQSRMASELGFSASYLNLIERNQRPVSAQLLLRLAEVYDVELRSIAGDDEAKAFAELTEVFSDPMFRGIDLPKAEVQEIAAASPSAATAIATLYRVYRENKQRTDELALRFADHDRSPEILESAFPVDEVRDFIHAQRNHFPELDEAAEALHQTIGLGDQDSALQLSERLAEQHGIGVRIMPVQVMPEALRFFDRHRRQLMLSELLRRSGRNFQMAHQIGLLEYHGMIDQVVAGSELQHEESRSLCRIILANYFAAALLLPYGKFRADAEELKYDTEHLGRRYGASFEQVCHRLTTLQRPGARGIPFFFLRVDNAGNVTKRYSAGRFHFSHFGGTCPLWNVHDTFATPGRISTQIIRMPDETTYFSIARTVRRAGSPYNQPEQQLAIALGCEIKFAKELIYAKGYDLDNPEVTLVGPNCRLCERPNCAQRAHPPISRALILDERSRGISPFRFSLDG